MSKTICIIQARSDSERLPGKALLKINGKPVIDRICNRVKAVNLLKPGLIDDIIVAFPINDKLMGHKFPDGIKSYSGSHTNVLERFYKCARMFNADWILRICGDCPDLQPTLLYGLLTKEPRKPYQALAVNAKSIVDGHDAELFSYEELTRVFNTHYIDEHCSTHMRDPEENQLDYGTSFCFNGIKLSLDTPEDLEFIKRYGELAW